jgi:hypothetical protein
MKRSAIREAQHEAPTSVSLHAGYACYTRMTAMQSFGIRTLRARSGRSAIEIHRRKAVRRTTHTPSNFSGCQALQNSYFYSAMPLSFSFPRIRRSSFAYLRPRRAARTTESKKESPRKCEISKSMADFSKSRLRHLWSAKHAAAYQNLALRIAADFVPRYCTQ